MAPLIGRSGAHGLDDCTDEQRRFRAQLALFLFNATSTATWSHPQRHETIQHVRPAWAALNRFWPSPDTLVVTTTSPDALRRALVGEHANGTARGMPGLRYDHTNPPSFIHIPTGTTLRVQISTPNSPLHKKKSGGKNHTIISREQQLLNALPQITEDTEQPLAALLIRLPLADPDGIWTLSKGHLNHTERKITNLSTSPPEIDSYFLIERGSSLHFRWNRPIQAFDIAAALTDTLTGLAGATAVLRLGHPLTVSYGTAKLNLHGEV